ncbi:MAG: alpha/beta hydrolase-fold protein [Anaerolineae bacterium]|nr:alpha/beta hydrolase-fold protein [Anaerolineae bacterium]MDW8173848.1 alpha/beta hydrolase-fold protein [Anaerolineae bacterium]
MDSKTILQRLEHEGAPLIDEDGATFVWVGQDAPLLCGDFNDWKPQRLKRAASGLWTFHLPLPPDAYMEYIYTDDPDDSFQTLPDPYNSRTIDNGFGRQNHFFAMPEFIGAHVPQPDSSTPRGRISQHTISSAFTLAGGQRTVYLYQPAVAEPVPLLVVYDGSDYLYRADLARILDAMIAQKQVRPLALALIENGGPSRFIEYINSDATLYVVLRLLLPLARRELNLLDLEQQPGAYGALGASMGGLMALYTGLRLPHIFGHVISQSGAFDYRLDERTAPMIEQIVQYMPRSHLKIWQDVGRYEWLLPANRRMNGALRRQDYHVFYHECNSGHNYTSWRATLPLALKAIYGV